MAKIAIVRVTGLVKKSNAVLSTMRMLRLYNKNYCTVVENTPAIMGMITRVKDYVTYGEMDEKTFKELVEKRGEEYSGREKDEKGKIDYSRRFIIVEGKKYKKFFRLTPPKKGYGRRGIKRAFARSGALGYRGTKINDLISRMI